ncbi:MAG TPA: MBL fold metallo-hydrolase, partial [Candidatus Dormibacteraeota bacterium]
MRFISLGHATGVVEVAGTRVLVDPWLTRRLDRMWERSPAIQDSLWDVIEQGIDAIVLTHHHCDHLHYPTLRLLRSRLGEEWAKRVPVYYPAPASSRFTGSGMGHLPIPLTLRLCGYAGWQPVQVGTTVEFPDLTVRTFPSRVSFPEMSLCFQSSDGVIMWCADAMLHPATWEQVTSSSAPPVGLALVPAHSYTPGNILTERKLIVSYEAARRRSETYFDRYASTMDAELLIPFACGWWVNT